MILSLSPPTFMIEFDFHLYFVQTSPDGQLLGQAGTLPFPETYGNHFSVTNPVELA